MKFLSRFPLLLPVIVCVVIHVEAQRPDEILATSNGMTYRATSLSPEAQKLFSDQRKIVSETRTELLSEMIVEELLALESKATGSTPGKLLAAEGKKIAEPAAAEIESVYNANRNSLGGQALDEARPRIVDFIKRNSEQKALEAYIKSLRTKYKVVFGKDVNTIGLAPSDVLVTIGTRSITLQEFEQANRVKLNDAEMEVFENLQADLEVSILSSLVAEDAKARNVDVTSYIASEVTDKLTEFTDQERAIVESDLMRRLFTKYNVKILMRPPSPIVHNVSVDDDPQTGSATAPVTVVMFTDFQCSACSRAHPVLKLALREYGDRVRFVVRDFPLENIHENAFAAALAANAARAQGKFTEYTEILYRNQDALDKGSLIRYATELGLNVKQFELDFSDARTAAEVRKDQADGRSYGIGGTPGIFVNGVKVHRLSLNGFRAALDRALKK